MDPSAAPLSFVHSTPGAAFVVFFCIGLAGVCAVYLLRPWPPTRRHVAMLAVLLVVLAGVAVGVSRRQVVWIDADQRVVQRQSGVPGFERVQQWSFAQVTHVGVRLSSDHGAFELGLQVGNQWIALDDGPEVTPVEHRARELAALGGWTALRQGYRMELRARGGEMQGLDAPSGRRVLSVDLDPVLQVVATPGGEQILD